MHAQSLLTIAALTALTACPSSSPRPVQPTPAGSDACADAAPNIYRAGEGRAEPGSSEEGRVLAAIADTCRTQAWSGELISCMGGVETIKEGRPCRDLMSESQSKYLEDAFEAGDDEAPPADVPEVSHQGIWTGTFDNLRGSGHRIELTGSTLNYARPDNPEGSWFIEEAYTRRDDGLLVLDRADAIADYTERCAGGWMQPPACEVPELACVRVDEVTDTQIELSYGLDCSELELHFTGRR